MNQIILCHSAPWAHQWEATTEIPNRLILHRRITELAKLELLELQNTLAK